MTDLLEQLHADAIINLLRADPGLTVYDALVPNPTPDMPYIVVYVSLEWPRDADGNALNGLAISALAIYECHCVGMTGASVRAMTQRVRIALLNQRPTITGRICGLLRQEAADPPHKDESTGVPVLNAVSAYSLMTLPG